MKRWATFFHAALVFSVVSWNAAAAQVGVCTGDCNHDASVTIDELVAGVDMAIGGMSVGSCPDLDPGGDERVSIDELVAAVDNALRGCNPHTNRAPRAEDVSLSAGAATSYLQKQLVGSDPDDDTITYELVADEVGPGYTLAFLNPETGVLYLTLDGDFEGTITLPYRVTDGKLFSNVANVTVDTAEADVLTNGGVHPIDPREYATFPRGFYNGALLGGPGEDPRMPSAVDLSADYPLPGAQGRQNSCVGWALGYAMKSYQERVELGWSLEPLEHQFSPAYIYNQLNGGEDHGSNFTAALNLVVNEGVATLATMPYDQYDFLTQPSFAARQEAAQFKAFSWKEANGVLEMKEALANHLAVLMVVQISSELIDLRGSDSVFNTATGFSEGLHAVTAVGYDDNRYGGAFRVMNSWGRNWGDGGFFWLPYSMAGYLINSPTGPAPVLSAAAVLEDATDPNAPPSDPVDPPPTGDLPDLQVTNWQANFNGIPGGSGSLQYTITNTGLATAPAGSYVALILSSTPDFNASNTLVVYEQIPFDVAPGTTVYRDANNTIAFNFPNGLQPGQYYMALWADIWNDVGEWNEQNNLSPSGSLVDIVNTFPDMQVVTWYSQWDELGIGSLTYDVVNDGGTAAPAGWLITLALSSDDVIGDGDEIFLFSEPANFDVFPGGTLYRDDSSAAGFSLYFDYFGNPVPDGTYYLALWLDPNGSLAESNEYNNASLSWGTIDIGLGGGGGADAAETSSPPVLQAYNGKVLPDRQAERKVRITTASEGRRQMEFLADSALDDGGPRLSAAESKRLPKVARARQQVVFPVNEMKPMPAAN